MASSSICHIRSAGQLHPLPQAHLAGMGADGERRKRTQLDLKEKGKVTMAFFPNHIYGNSRSEISFTHGSLKLG